MTDLPAIRARLANSTDPDEERVREDIAALLAMVEQLAAEKATAVDAFHRCRKERDEVVAERDRLTRTLARELIAAREERDAYRTFAARIAVMVAPADAADLAVSHLTVDDLGNLGDTVEQRFAEPPGHIAVCPECRCEYARCDEDRCCLNWCGVG